MRNQIYYILILYLLLPSTQSAQNIHIPKDWIEGRPYWDMQGNQISDQVLRKSKKTLEYQLNPFHQPNEIYGKETCHGGGDYDGSGIGQSDQDAAQAGTNHYALDVTGNNIVNAEDATEIQNFRDNLIPYLKSHWNFLSKNEKIFWFPKIASIYSVNNKPYIEGDESTRYISGNFATEFCIRMQGYNKELTDLLGDTRKEIPNKYDKGMEFNGRRNIPVYFVNFTRTTGGHGMNWFLAGDNPLNFEDGRFYEPQTNQIVDPRNYPDSNNSTIHIYKLENFGGSSWGEDMPSRFIGNPQETTKILTFGIDNSGNVSLLGQNENLLTTKPTVSIGSELNMPKDYWLGNNYPNPFNSNTTIQFNIPLNPPV